MTKKTTRRPAKKKAAQTETKVTKTPNLDTVLKYVDDVIEGRKLASKEIIQACKRFREDMENPEYDFNPKDAEFAIQIIEKTFVHDKGERLDGTPLRGQPFLLEPWQKFIVYNLLSFFFKGTKIRRYKEAFIFLPRKNGKTRFVAALAWALDHLYCRRRVTPSVTGGRLYQLQFARNGRGRKFQGVG